MDSSEQQRLIEEISVAEYKYNARMQVALNDTLKNLTHDQSIVFLFLLTYLADWASMPQDEHMNGSDKIINIPIGLSAFDDLGVTPLARMRLAELSEILDFHVILCTNGKKQLALRVNDHNNILRTSLLHLYDLYKVGSCLRTHINIQSGRVCNDDNIVSLGCKTEQDLEGIDRLPIHILRGVHEQVMIRSNLIRALEGDGDVDGFQLDLTFYESIKDVKMISIPRFSRDCRLEFKSYETMKTFMRLWSSTYKIQSLGTRKLVTIDHSGAYQVSSTAPSMTKLQGSMILLSCVPRQHSDTIMALAYVRSNLFIVR